MSATFGYGSSLLNQVTDGSEAAQWASDFRCRVKFSAGEKIIFTEVFHRSFGIFNEVFLIVSEETIPFLKINKKREKVLYFKSNSKNDLECFVLHTRVEPFRKMWPKSSNSLQNFDLIQVNSSKNVIRTRLNISVQERWKDIQAGR